MENLRHRTGGGSESHGGREAQVQGMRCGLPARGALRLRAVLRTARGRLRPSCDHARRGRAAPAHPGGSRGRVALQPTSSRWSAGRPGPATSSLATPGLPAGWTPLTRADRLAERLGLREVWVKNDAANPTHSFKDRVVAVASARARELGFHALACASTGNLGNAVAASAAAVGLPSYVFIPSDLEEREDPRDRRVRVEPRRGARQLRRRQPAVHRGLGRARGLGVREHQHAPVLLRGLQDGRLRDHRAARLGAAGPRASCRSPQARCSPRFTVASPSGPRWGL